MLTKKIRILCLSLAGLLCLQIPVGAFSGNIDPYAPLSYTKEDLAQLPKEVWDNIDKTLEAHYEHKRQMAELDKKMAQQDLEYEYKLAELERLEHNTDILSFREASSTIAERELKNSIRKTKRKKIVRNCIITISTIAALGTIVGIAVACVKGHKHK